MSTVYNKKYFTDLLEKLVLPLKEHYYEECANLYLGHSLFVVSVHYVFDRCRICLGVVLRYLFRQDSVSVSGYFSRHCGGKRSSAPD